MVIELTKKFVKHGLVLVDSGTYGQLWYHALIRAERESENKIFSALNRYIFYFLSAWLVGLFSIQYVVFVLFLLLSADSLSRTVHCARDENDRPSEQTITLNYHQAMFLFILVSSLELNNSVTQLLLNLVLVSLLNEYLPLT